MASSGSNRKIREILTGIRDGVIVPRPDFQRRLVWSQRDKNAFIRTVIEDFPFPEVYFANGDVDLQSGEGKTLIVDGQQRLTTLFEYFNASSTLRLESGMPKYSDLSDDEKLHFLNYDVVVRDLGSISQERIKEIFLRINSTSYSVNSMETANARFNGALKAFAERLSEHPVFMENRVFTQNDIKRMNDVRLALTIVISLLSGYFNRDELFENYLMEFNDEFPRANEIERRFHIVSSFLRDLSLPESNRMWKKADLLTAFIELDRADVRTINAGRLRELLIMFDEAAIDGDGVIVNDAGLLDHVPHLYPDDLFVYFKASVQASNDRLNRVRRGEVLQKIILAARLV